MAQKMQILLIDDVDGGEADETVTFGVDGVTYEIDLSTDKADKLRESLAPYLSAGRRTGGRSGKPSPRAGKTRLGADPQAARAWAKSHHIEINDRGRVPGPIIDAFEAYERGDKAPLAKLQEAAAKADEATLAAAGHPAVEAETQTEPAPDKRPAAKKTAVRTAAKKAAAPK